MCHSWLAVLRAGSGFRPLLLCVRVSRYQHAVGLHVCMWRMFTYMASDTAPVGAPQSRSLDAGRPMEICAALCFQMLTRDRCSWGHLVTCFVFWFRGSSRGRRRTSTAVSHQHQPSTSIDPGNFSAARRIAEYFSLHWDSVGLSCGVVQDLILAWLSGVASRKLNWAFKRFVAVWMQKRIVLNALFF